MKNAQFKHNGPGLPTSIAVHSKFLAIGTSHSLVIVFDHFQEVRIVLGDWKKSRDGVVTTIDVSWDSDYLVAGYQSGKIILWNILNGKEEKVLDDAHDCPVVNLRFWPSSKHGLSVASLDVKGRINLLVFNKRLFTWYVDRRCLVNENTGSKVALSVLPPAPEHVLEKILKNKREGFKAAFELLIFSSHASTIIVALNPEPTRLRQWDRPSSSSLASDEYLPCIAANWGVVGTNKGSLQDISSGATKIGSPLQPIIARAWDTTIECIKIAVHRSEATSQQNRLRQMTLFKSSSPIVALEWSSSNILVYMNVDYRVCFLNTELFGRDGNRRLISIEFGICNLTKSKGILIYHRSCEWLKYTKNIKIKGQQARSFLNSMRSCDDDDRLYFLSRSDLCVAKLQKWTEQIKVLKDNGEWIEALLLGLEQYNFIHAGESRKMAQIRWNRILFGDNGNASRNLDDQIIADLLMDYVEISLSRDITTEVQWTPAAQKKSSSRHGPTQIVCEVCIDYCTSINRADLLFGPIYERFVRIGAESVFLELLEKYILRDRVSYVPAIVFQDLLKYLNRLNRMKDVEKCVLHLDARRLDIDGIVRLCAENKLFDALTYVFNNGIMEYAEPIKYIIRELKEATDKHIAEQSDTSFEKMTAEYFRKKLFSYFSKIMGQVNGTVKTGGDRSPHRQILNLLFTKDKEYGFYPLIVLLETDGEEVFGVLSSVYGTALDGSVDKTGDLSGCLKVLEQVIVDEKGKCLLGGNGSSMEKAKKYIILGKHFSMFISSVYSRGYHAAIEVRYLVDSLVDLSTNNMGAKVDTALHVKCEDAIMAILKTYRDCEGAREPCLDMIIPDLAQFTYQLGDLNYNRALAILNEIQGNIEEALDSYLHNADHQYRQQAFRYTLDVYSYLDRNRGSIGQTESGTVNFEKLHSIVLKNLQIFSEIDRGKTTEMIMEIFGDDSESLCDILRKIEDPFLQYNCLQEIISSQAVGGKKTFAQGTVNISAPETATIGNANQVVLPPSLYQLYVELLCRFDPASILGFLKEHDGYSLDNCLNICKENDVIDATAYLLERTGNIEDALKMLLKFLRVCLTNLLSLDEDICPCCGKLGGGYVESAGRGKRVL